jgi:hypothetical protein
MIGRPPVMFNVASCADFAYDENAAISSRNLNMKIAYK